jgi:hypothetical protein
VINSETSEEKKQKNRSYKTRKLPAGFKIRRPPKTYIKPGMDHKRNQPNSPPKPPPSPPTMEQYLIIVLSYLGFCILVAAYFFKMEWGNIITEYNDMETYVRGRAQVTEPAREPTREPSPVPTFRSEYFTEGKRLLSDYLIQS